MKIIKSFPDHDFINSRLENKDGHFDEWYWGLGNDGELYYRTTENELHPDQWYAVDYTLSYDIRLKDMKKLVKEFGHLLVWL